MKFYLHQYTDATVYNIVTTSQGEVYHIPIHFITVLSKESYKYLLHDNGICPYNLDFILYHVVSLYRGSVVAIRTINLPVDSLI